MLLFLTYFLSMGNFDALNGFDEQIYNPPPFWIIDASKLIWSPLPSPSKRPR